MSNKLQQYFPMIRTQNEILEKINSDPALFDTFRQWEPEHQQEFLDFCSGAKGVKMLYDGFSKSILNPYVFPERLNELLSLLLKTEVTIIGVLPNDDTRIADESSLVIMDILVQLQDGSYANVEIQRVGYYFPVKGAPAIPLISCSDNISMCAEKKQRKLSPTMILKTSIPSYFSKKVLSLSIPSPTNTYIFLNRNQTPD